MQTLKEVSLFSGIGGFTRGAEMAGIETVLHCECEPYNQKILKQHYRNVPVWDDVRTLTKEKIYELTRHFEEIRTAKIILTGGFPCQNISIAGRGEGITGEQSSLWNEMFRIVDELRPAYVVIENSPELLKKGFEKVLYPLSQIGYDAEWQCLRASDFGLPHRRERVYCVAYSNEVRRERLVFESDIMHRLPLPWAPISSNVLMPSEWDDGFRNRAAIRRGDVVPDRVDRIAALGNAVIPTIAHYLFECIKAHAQTNQIA